MVDIFTFTEKTVKRHNVGFIKKQARAVLNDLRIEGLCGNNLPCDNGQLYTTKEASEIINDVVDDSIYYSGKWMG